MDVALPLSRRSGQDLSTSFVGSLGVALRRSSLPPRLPSREPSEPASLQTPSASRDTPPSSCRCSRDWGSTTTPPAPAAAKDITPWRFVGMVGNTLLSPLVPGRLGADPWTAMMDRMPDRGRCAITTLDQEAMGSPDDLLLVHSPAGRAHDRVPGPSPRGGVDASRGIARATSALLDEALGPEEPALSSSSTRSRICSSAMTKLLASSPCPRPTRCAARIRRETHWAHGGNDVSGMQLTHASPAAPEGGQQGCRQAVRRCASSGMARSRGIPFTGSFEASSSRRDSAELAVGVVALVFAVRFALRNARGSALGGHL